MTDPTERDPELMSDLLADLQELDSELAPIAEQFESQQLQETPSERGSEGTQEGRTSSQKRVGRLNSVKVAAKNALLITDPDTYLRQEELELVDLAQVTMNDLYRKDAKYGDGSSAFMLLVEQAAGGVGEEPQKIVADTLHQAKCEEYIVALEHKLGQGLPRLAEERIRDEISKMQEAVDWAENYRAGNEPKIPSWARAWKSQIEQYMTYHEEE